MEGRIVFFKVLIVGPGAVGKTSILERFVYNRFSENYKLTIGVNFLTKIIDLSGHGIVKLSIWDIGGQERFEMVRTDFYKGAVGAVIVFDLTRMETFNAIEKWLNEVRHYAGNIPFILIGNKADLLEHFVRVVEKEEAEEFARAHNSTYIETSAKTGENVDEAFQEFSQMLVETIIK
jgi:small GTP-binding protein